VSDAAKPAGRPRLVVFLPLVLFLGLAALFYTRLGAGDPSELPSALLGKPVPTFELPPVEGLTRDGAPVPGFSSAELTGGVTLVNVFASWCVPCRDEHPILVELAKDTRFRLLGLNYKDSAENAGRFLGALGNPYAAVGADTRGRVGIDWGVYGVPETFVVAADGTIAYKHVGPLNPQSVQAVLMPEIEKALAKAAPPAS
jgi:cytochrome c biogenesis protein CcmG/thiol:disulfide interchange protein DsbE